MRTSIRIAVLFCLTLMLSARINTRAEECGEGGKNYFSVNALCTVDKEKKCNLAEPEKALNGKWVCIPNKRIFNPRTNATGCSSAVIPPNNEASLTNCVDVYNIQENNYNKLPCYDYNDCVATLTTGGERICFESPITFTITANEKRTVNCKVLILVEDP